MAEFWSSPRPLLTEKVRVWFSVHQVLLPPDSENAPNQTNLVSPSGLAFDSSGNLWVSDSGAGRIVEFKAPFSDGENESVVLGLENFTSEISSNNIPSQSNLDMPTGIAFDFSGDLWVADTGYDRVVEFKAPLTTGESESIVIGQSNFTTGVQDIPGCPQSCSAQTSPTSLEGPEAVTFDSQGNLWVADSHGGRVLKYSAPLSTGESASLGLGVVNLNTPPGLFCISGGPYCIGFPDSLVFDKSGNLWVTDDTNGRVLQFSPPFSMNESASLVIGQPNFTTISPVAVEAFNVSQSDMYGDDGVAIDSSGNLWVSDGGDNRVLEFSAAVVGSSSSSSSSTPTVAASSSSTTSAVVITSSTPAPVSATSSSPTSSTQSATPIVASTSQSSSSSSSSLSLNYLAVVAVVGVMMAGTFVVVVRRRRSS